MRVVTDHGVAGIVIPTRIHQFEERIEERLGGLREGNALLVLVALRLFRVPHKGRAVELETDIHCA